MIPAFPMDGGRVLRALLCLKLKRPLATRISATLGQGFAIFLIFQGFRENIFLAIIGVFIFFAAEGEAQYTRQIDLLKGLTVGDVMMCQYPTLKRHETIENIIEALLDSTYKRFLVIEDDKVVGLLTDDMIIDAFAHHNEKMPIGNLMRSDMQILSPNMSLEAALLLLNDKELFLPVQEDGQVVGVLDAQNIAKFFTIRQIKQKKAKNTEGGLVTHKEAKIKDNIQVQHPIHI